jgi:hypothetical protein
LAGTWKGRDGAARWFDLLAETVEFGRFNPEGFEFVSQGDTVVVKGYEECTMPAENNKALVRRCRSLLGLLFLAMLAPLHAAAQAPGDHAPMTREAFDALFARVDNTGRWGELDQMGTLNLITPEVRLQAFQEVRDGGTVSLAHELVAGPIPGAFEEMQLDFMALSDTVPRLRGIPDLAGDVTVTGGGPGGLGAASRDPCA